MWYMYWTINVQSWLFRTIPYLHGVINFIISGHSRVYFDINLLWFLQLFQINILQEIKKLMYIIFKDCISFPLHARPHIIILERTEWGIREIPSNSLFHCEYFIKYVPDLSSSVSATSGEFRIKLHFMEVFGLYQHGYFITKKAMFTIINQYMCTLAYSSS